VSCEDEVDLSDPWWDGELSMVKDPRSFLVMGGAGFIGSTLCLRLRKVFGDARIVALDNLHRRGSELQVPRLMAAGVEFVHGDVGSRDDVEQAGPCDLVVDAAAECSVLAGVDEEPGYVVRSNLIGTINCLDYARTHGAGVILLSSSRVYPISKLRAFELEKVGDRFELVNANERRGVTTEGVTEQFPLDCERTLYGATKLAGELLAHEYFSLYGLRGVINRCGVVAGPWQMAKVEQGVVGLWCARHQYGGELSYIGFEGYQVRDVLHVEDLVDLLIREIRMLDEVSGETFNVGGGRSISVSLRELTALCQEATGNRIPVTKVTEERRGDVPWYISDTSKVREWLGWSPIRDMREIVTDTVGWLRDNEVALKSFLA